MFKVCKGQKIKNINNGECIRNYYGGEMLPESYEPPKSYIDQKIVEEVKNVFDMKKKGGK